MNFGPPSINVISPPSRSIAPPQIIWPSADGYGDNGADFTRFPGLRAIKARQSAEEVPMLAAFLEATGAAQQRIWILDDYLFKTRNGKPLQGRIDQVMQIFPLTLVGNDIRLLTKEIHGENRNISDQLQGHASQINGFTRNRVGRCQIDVRFTLASHFPHVHDRFAIIDDELWHFGATVGGLHELVNAASRGWRTDDHGAIEFFELAWAGDRDYGAIR